MIVEVLDQVDIILEQFVLNGYQRIRWMLMHRLFTAWSDAIFVGLPMDI